MLFDNIRIAVMQNYVEELPVKTKKDVEATLASIANYDIDAVETGSQLISDIFPNSSTVQEGKQMEEVQIACEQYLKYSQLYIDKYPDNLFLVERDVKHICEKYNLVMGEAKHYIEQIPPTNQKEIIAFTKLIKEEDRVRSDRDRYEVLAPRKEFNSRLISDKDKKWKLSLPITPDPIVLCAVNGGYLVVSKWGKEADIPEVNVKEDKPKKKPFIRFE